MLSKSPSGSLCPYYYKGGELHPLHYGSFRRDRAAFCETMKAEEAFILSSHGNRYVWIDLYETALDQETIPLLATHLQAIEPQISRLALVGCPPLARFQLTRTLKARSCGLHRSIMYFSDPERAKDWLVGEC